MATKPRPQSVLTFSMTPPNDVVASWKRRDIFKVDSCFISLSRALR
jgi:hypothetical protein